MQKTSIATNTGEQEEKLLSSFQSSIILRRGGGGGRETYKLLQASEQRQMVDGSSVDRDSRIIQVISVSSIP